MKKRILLCIIALLLVILSIVTAVFLTATNLNEFWEREAIRHGYAEYLEDGSFEWKWKELE